MWSQRLGKNVGSGTASRCNWVWAAKGETSCAGTTFLEYENEEGGEIPAITMVAFTVRPIWSEFSNISGSLHTMDSDKLTKQHRDTPQRPERALCSHQTLVLELAQLPHGLLPCDRSSFPFQSLLFKANQPAVFGTLVVAVVLGGFRAVDLWFGWNCLTGGGRVDRVDDGLRITCGDGIGGQGGNGRFGRSWP